MAREGARIIAGVCGGAVALTAPLAWAAPPLEAARQAVAEAASTAASSGRPWAGWTRRGGALEREGWAVRATTLERTTEGWLARGEVSVSGPRGVYVRAARVEIGDATARALATGEAPAALVGQGWTIEGGHVEVDLERARVTVVALGARDETRR